MIRRVLAISILILSGTAVPEPATAQTDAEYLSAINFRFTNPGARARGMGGVLVPLADDDATAAFVNPAGLASFDQWQFSLELASDEDEFPAPRVETGLTASGPAREPTRSTIASSSESVSFASFLKPFQVGEKRLTLSGFYSNLLDDSSGSTEVFIDSALFPEIDSATAFFPTFNSVSAQNEVIGLSIGFGLVPNKLSVGASVGLSRLDFRGLTRRVDLEDLDAVQNTQSSFVDAEEDVFVTLGALFTPSESFSIGVSWQKQTGYDMVNSFDFVGDDEDRDFDSEFTIPTRVAAGFVHKTEQWTWGVEVDHIQYSDLFEEAHGQTFFALETDPASYGYEIPDVTEIHMGVERKIKLDKGTLFLRGGYWRDETHVPFYTGTDPLLLAWAPELDEEINHWTTGIGFEGDRYAVGLAVDYSADAGTDFLLSWIYKAKKPEEQELVAPAR